MRVKKNGNFVLNILEDFEFEAFFTLQKLKSKEILAL